jgi:hypothetical protein
MYFTYSRMYYSVKDARIRNERLEVGGISICNYQSIMLEECVDVVVPAVPLTTVE